MSRMISRTLALLTAILAVAAMSAAPAHAGEAPAPDPYPSTECTVSVDNDSPAPGDTITITGEKWDPGATAVISVGGAEVGNATVGDDGTFSFEYTIPSDAEGGDYAVEVDGCEGAGEVLGTTITVVEPAAEEPRALPATGSSSTEPLVRTGAVLIVAGAVLVYAMRRRNQAASS